MRPPARLLVVLAMIAGFALAFALTPPRGPRSMRQFGADRLAALEVRMWIAEQYALLYESSPAAMAAPATLRAPAAALRDARAESPDWSTIARLLQQSCRELRQALATANA